MRGERPTTPSSDTKRQFDAWFHHEMARASAGQPEPPSLVNPGVRQSPDKAPNSPITTQDPLSVTDPSAVQHQRSDGLPPRVRMRTTFDPEQELPRLQRWFSENQHPTRFQVS